MFIQMLIRAFNILLLWGLFYGTFLFIRTKSRYNQQVEGTKKSFWQRESDANSIRRADISNLDYIKVPLDTFSLKDVSTVGLSEEVNALKALSEKKILNLSMYSNTDLKLMYGPANLEELSICDDNYANLIKLLNKMGTALYDANRGDLALSFLEYAVNIDSDITATFVTLGNIYKEKADVHKLDALISKAESLSSITSKAIVTKLNNIKSQEK